MNHQQTNGGRDCSPPPFLIIVRKHFVVKTIYYLQRDEVSLNSIFRVYTEGLLSVGLYVALKTISRIQRRKDSFA